MRRRREWSAAGLPWVVDLMRVHALDTAVTLAAGGRESEARRELRMVDLIDRADLYWITARMTDLVIGAAETVPEWAPAVAIPSDSGLIVWETPVGVTTGLGGFPRDVQVGKVSRVVKNPAGLYQEIEVTPDVDFARLSEVLVVVAPPPTPDPEAGKKALAPSRGLAVYK